MISARQWENKVLHRMDAVKSKRWLNASYGMAIISNSGTVSAKSIITGRTLLVTKDEFTANNELAGVAIGFVAAKDSKGNIIRVTKDEFTANNELVGVMKGIKNYKVSIAKKGIPSGTKGYTNEFRQENNLKIITGRPKGSKDSDKARKNRSEKKAGKVCVRRSTKDKGFYVSKDDPLIDIEYFRVLTNKGKRRKHAPGTTENFKGPKVKVCCVDCKQETSVNWLDRHIVRYHS